jgi:pimeloyl-ACP methyl ester carboxylesterase
MTRNQRTKAILSIIAVLFVLVLVPLGVLLIVSRGTPKPFLDDSGRPLPGSIAEKIKVDINGVKQGMFIKGRSTRNPVLLCLHGGMPDYFLTEHYPTGLDEDFTMVWWEQRGSGISYDATAPLASVNTEQLVSDTVAITNYLRVRFGRDKIYLMGHSGGTFIGIQTAAQAPELYHAYLGVAQMSNQLESERLAYNYMLQRFKDDGNSKMARQDILRRRPVEHATVDRPGNESDSARHPRLLLSWRVRLHRFLPLGQILLPTACCASEGLLHVQAVSSQSLV